MTIKMTIKMTFKIIVLTSLSIGLMVNTTLASQTVASRFFHSGDGVIHLSSRKNGKVFKGIYREGNGQYNADAYKQISAVFDAPYQSSGQSSSRFSSQVLSLRLIEFIDFLEDQLGKGSLVTITSGYRAPAYNTKLRKGGGLAAKASLHQYGMAADFIMDGVPSERVWEYVRSIGFGGTGYYHGETVHVDVGPSRFWDEKTSGVGTGLSDDNKLIGLVTDYDIYAPGDLVTLSFIRMTAFPIKVRSQFQLIPMETPVNGNETLSFQPDSEGFSEDDCGEFHNIGEMDSFRWRIPSDIKQGRYRIRAGFCGDRWDQMPKDVFTPEFEIR